MTNNQAIKTTLHPRNRNRKNYDIKALIKVNPDLKNFIVPNKFGGDSIDFSNPAAVKLLNTSILNHYFKIKYWKFPDHNLCPPIPGRADYIHHIADLLAESNQGKIPNGNKITCLDIGMGASCIYPILGVTEYGWNFIGSEIDPKSIKSAKGIVDANASLKNKIECRLQPNQNNILYGILGKTEKIDVTICNPPFHASLKDALSGTRRKVRNLSGKREVNPVHNFAGNPNELVYAGGEYKFIHNLITESEKFAKNSFWFSTIVSKQANLLGINKLLEKSKVQQIITKNMGTGNKATRMVAWTFLSKVEQKDWAKTRWGSL